MKKALALILITLGSVSLFSQQSKIKWYKVNDIEKLIIESPRPVFIDTYTDWCVWCKRLDSNTFTNSVIADILNNKFYAVKFNAEGKDTVTFMGKSFINDGKYGAAHQLGVGLLKGQMSYPTVVFLNEKGQELTVVAGYQVAREFEVVLTYFGKDAYLKSTFEEFKAGFQGELK